MFKKQNLFVADWWHFDSVSSVVYGEYRTSNDSLKFFHFHTLLVKVNVDNAWLAVSSDKDRMQKILLWKDKELVPEQEIVAEVWPWFLRAGVFTRGIYACIAGKCRWEWDPSIKCRLYLGGKYRDGAFFEDTLRLLVPLENGSVIALGTRNRQYYLHGSAVDMEEILSPKSKHKSRKYRSIS